MQVATESILWLQQHDQHDCCICQDACQVLECWPVRVAHHVLMQNGMVTVWLLQLFSVCAELPAWGQSSKRWALSEKCHSVGQVNSKVDLKLPAIAL